MRKTVLPMLLLLGSQQVFADMPETKELKLSQYASSSEIEEHLQEYAFHFESITEYTINEITEFWKNKTDGEYCTSLFIKIVEHYELVVSTVHDIDAWVDEYNEKCSDKCLPGYVRCEGDYSGKCIKGCDCCEQHYLHCCQGTNNHPSNDHNYATGDSEVLYCYDWCCPETHTYCVGDCIPDTAEMPYGYGPAYEPVDYPKVCCEGQGCCEEGETFIEYLTTHAPFCCAIDSVISAGDKYSEPVCCCENEYDLCCPNLSQHCQPASNTLCCEEGYIDCHGECWPEDKPCCDAPAFNCPSQYDKCVEYCCCDDYQECCEKRKQCQPFGALCCGWHEFDCYGKCIPEGEHCCPAGTSWCDYTNSCEEHCCDKKKGFFWCEETGKCDTHCCPHYTVWCPYSNKCVDHEKYCCPLDTPYCKWTDKCAPYCCEYSQFKHEVWCPLTKQCEDECNCCQSGYEACKCTSGAYNNDKTCYKSDGKECCEYFWCEHAHKCVADEVSCCIESGYTYVGAVAYNYEDKYCCPAGSTHYSLGVPEEYSVVGCCHHSSQHSNCCREPHSNEKEVIFHPETGKCEPVELPPCPCEGCCDFNCCDELDFFMHRAFYEHYNTEYGSFMEFYEDWYHSFYHWWHSPSDAIEHEHDESY